MNIKQLKQMLDDASGNDDTREVIGLVPNVINADGQEIDLEITILEVTSDHPSYVTIIGQE